MTDDAVAPVIAAMLILATLSSFLAVWYAVAIPSMKAESEIGHSHAVEQSFTRFSADLGNAASLRREIRLEEPVMLGGGDIVFNSLKSSGTLRVGTEPAWIYQIRILDSAGEYMHEGQLVNFSYHPIGNAWLDQGYAWHYGYVNVTKYSGGIGADNAVMSTPLNYPAMDDVRMSPSLRAFAESLVAVDSRPWINSSANCSSVTVSAVTFSSSQENFVSGNGIGILAVVVAANETRFGDEKQPYPREIRVRVNPLLPDHFSSGIYNGCNRSFEKLAGKYPGNLVHVFGMDSGYNETGIRIRSANRSLPFTVTREIMHVNVSAR